MSLRDLVTANACAPEQTTSSGAGPSSAANPLAALANALHAPTPAGSSSTAPPPLSHHPQLPTDPVSLLHANLPDPLTQTSIPPPPATQPIQHPPLPLQPSSSLADQFFVNNNHNPVAAPTVFETAFANARASSSAVHPQQQFQHGIPFHQPQQQTPYSSYVQPSASYSWHRANVSDLFTRLAISQTPISDQQQQQPVQSQSKFDNPQQISRTISHVATTTTDTASWGDEFSSFETTDPLPDLSTVLDESAFELSGGVEAAYASWLARAEEFHSNTTDTYQFTTHESNSLQNSTRSAEEALTAAIALREAGRLPPAIVAFEEALNRPLTDTNPPLSQTRMAAAWYLLGITLAESDDDEKAIQALEQGLKLYDAKSAGNRREDNPHLWHTLIALAVSFTNELDEPRALRAISEWIQLWKAVRSGDTEAGIIPSLETPILDTGEEIGDQLRRDLIRASEKAPEDCDIFVVLGIFYNLNREYEQAVAAFRHAVMLRTTDSNLWNKLGATLANGGDSDEALRSYRKAVDLNPSLIRAWVNVGTAYSNRGELQKATRYYLKAISMANERDSEGNSSVKEEDHMQHVWGFLRVTVMSMSKPELLQLIENKDLNGLRKNFNF